MRRRQADPKYARKDIQKQHLRVAPYCRVSTGSEEQLNSYASQTEYYTQRIAANPDWTMVQVYADGIRSLYRAKDKQPLAC